VEDAREPRVTKRARRMLLADTASVRDGVVHGGGGGEEVENRQQRARGPERAARLECALCLRAGLAVI